MVVFILSVFLSSFLLFQIQPLLAKFILPWFGGTSGVWSASLLFFQVFLTAGYAYANWLTTRFSRRWQGRFHLAWLGMSIVLLLINRFQWNSPILPGLAWRPETVFQPLANVVKTLFVAVGIPYFLLSSNSTLMQVWFRFGNQQRSPYPLYAVSNLGSLVGLISYPFLFEPIFRLTTQAYLWFSGYCVFVLFAGFQAWMVQRRVDSEICVENRDEADLLKPLKIRDQFSWILLPSLATILLLATTNQITQEIATIPFLWVLPFSIYLLSFILTFSDKGIYRRWIFVILLFVTTVLVIWFVDSVTTNIVFQIAVYTSLLFSVAMICHGELYLLRPQKELLTKFYLMVSVGGAVGGLAVNTIFPHLFSGFWEYQVGLGLVWMLVLFTILKEPLSNRYYLNRFITGVVGLAIIVVFASLYLQINEYEKAVLNSWRNFYGILRIKELSQNDLENHRYVLTHGVTTHGFQFTSPEKKRLPTSYYSEESGIGICFNHHPARPGPLRVGLVGLGAGVLASYGAEGDHFWFYEINPAVSDIAQSGYFTFLNDSKAEVEVILGDGRIMLEQELSSNGPKYFDLLVLDAFSSDSIPTHLLTVEAIELYMDHLKPEGLLAIHISNRFLDLSPVIWKVANTVGIDGVELYHTIKNERISPSRWIVLTNSQIFLNDPEVLRRQSENIEKNPNLRLWTDDYSNLLTILK